MSTDTTRPQRPATVHHLVKRPQPGPHPGLDPAVFGTTLDGNVAAASAAGFRDLRG